jgi:ComF family protein
MGPRLLPESCPACAGPTDRAFCAGCRAEFRRLARPCRVCGLPAPVHECPCRLSAWQVERVVAPYEYAYPLSHYLQALKFGRGRHLGRALGLLLADALLESALAGAAASAAVVAVPLHPRRLRQRGYNQALEIARAFARRLELQTCDGGLVRVAAAEPQSSLGARARRTNVANAFRAARDFRGRRVVIVDDVVTTGATINAAAAALLAAGAAGVEAVAVARTVPPAHEARTEDASHEADRLRRLSASAAPSPDPAYET